MKPSLKLFPLFIIIVAVMAVLGVVQSHAFNLVQDVRDNVVWKFGDAAQAGEGYNFTTQKWDSSALAEIAEYRFLSFSYGGTFLDSNSSQATDTFKVGFLSNFFFSLFKNQPTAAMGWMEHLNIGPSYAVPVFSGGTGHKGTFLLDVNFKFGS